MTSERQIAAPLHRHVAALIWMGRGLILIPEAPLIATLMGVYLALGGPPMIGLLAALLIIAFMVRAAALHMARAALEAARYRDADALIQVALALYPWSPDGLALRGALSLALGAPDAAEAALRQAVTLLPGQPTYYAALSGALLDLGRPAEAAQTARLALDLDGRCAIAYLYLAEAERALGIPERAVEDRLRAGLAVAAAPAAEAALRCALAGHLLAERRIAEATLTIHGAEALLPRCSSATQAGLRRHLGELLLAHGQTDRAREHLGARELLDPPGPFAA